MNKIKNYVFAGSLDEAYELNQKRTSVIMAGTCWVKMGNRNIMTAIDLSNLGLDQIEETESEFKIGAMVTLRQMELHEGLQQYTNGALKDCVRHIVGTQFRNCATVGGSLFGRFGFSDVLTCFLVLDAEVELFHAGSVSIQEFAKMKYDRDILVSVIIKKTSMKVAYECMRREATDFPVLAVAVAKRAEQIYLAIGARPAKAALVITDEAHLQEACDSFVYGTNMRASAEYRKYIAPILAKRGLDRIGGQA